MAVVVTDRNGTIEYVNPRFSALTGYSAQEAVGANPRILKSGKTELSTYRTMWTTILSGNVWVGELCNTKKSGALYWERAYVSPIFDPDGVATHFVAVKEDVTELKCAEERLRELSLQDELTGLYNRRGFVLLATQQLKLANRSKKHLVMVYVDLDGMKQINDDFGHAMGDRALLDAADVLRRSVRASDIVARLGGDEFVILAIEMAENGIKRMTERISENLHALHLEVDRPYQLAFSMGLSDYNPVVPCTLEELLERSDQLMYENKQRRKQAGLRKRKQ